MADKKQLELWCAQVREALGKKRAKAVTDSLPKSIIKLLSEKPLPYGHDKLLVEFKSLMDRIKLLPQDQRGDLALKNELAELEKKISVSSEWSKARQKVTALGSPDHPAVARLLGRLQLGQDIFLDKGHVEQARHFLGTLKDQIKNAPSEIKKSQQVEKSDSKAQGAAERLRSEMQSRIRYLEESCVGLGDLLRQLQKAVKDTDQAASRGQWAEVLRQLQLIDLPSQEECRQLSEAAIGDSGKQSMLALKGRAELQELARLLDPSEFAELRQGFNRALAAFLDEPKLELRIKNFEPALRTAVKAMEKLRLAAFQSSKDLNESRIQALRLKLKQLQDLAPLLDGPTQGFKERFDHLESCQVGRRFVEEAGLKLRQLEQQIDTRLDQLSSAQKTWASWALKLAPVREGLSKLSSKLDDFGPELAGACRALASQVNESDLLRNVEQNRDWLRLCDRAQQALTAWSDLKLQIERWEQLASKREESRKALVELFQQIDRTVVEAKKAANDAGLDGDGLQGQLQTQRVQLFQRVMGELKDALNPEDLKLDIWREEVRALLDRARLAGSKVGLEDRQAEQAMARERDAFEQEAARANGLIDQLERLDLDQAADFRKRLAQARNQGSEPGGDGPSAGSWKAAAGELALLIRDLDLKKKALEDEILKRRVTLNNRVTDLRKQIEDTPAPLKKSFPDLISGLQSELNDLATLGGGQSAQAFQLAMDELDRLAQRLVKLLQQGPSAPKPPLPSVQDRVKNGLSEEEAQAAFDKEEAERCSQATLGDLAHMLEQLKTQLEQAKLALGKTQPAERKRLEGVLKTLIQSSRSADPATTMAEALVLGRSIEQLLDKKSKMDDLLATDKGIPKTLAEADDLLLPLEMAGEYGPYLASLRERYRQAQKALAKALEYGSLELVRLNANALLQELKEVSAKPEALAQGQQNLEKERLSTDKLDAEWKGRFPSRRAWEAKVLEPAKEAVRLADGDRGLLKEIRNLVGRAEKLYKEGDVAGALSALRTAEARVDQVVQDPLGPALGRRRGLARGAAQFQADAVELRGLIKDLPSRAKERLAELDGEAEARLGKAMDQAAELIRPEVFHAVAARFEASDASPEELRAVREEAMALARRTRETLSQHPLMVQLLANPINRGVAVVMRRLLQHANRFEANVSRAVK